MFGWLSNWFWHGSADAAPPSAGPPGSAAISVGPTISAEVSLGPTITAQVILPMAKLKRGVANPIVIVYKNADGSARTGKTLKFFLVDATSKTPETATKIGSETMYSTTERVGTPGTYDGVFPYADSLKLSVQKERKYRVIPYEDGYFTGDDQSFEVDFA